MRRGTTTGDFKVGGDKLRRTWPTVGSALSLALTLASRAEAEDEFGVYRNDEKVARVARHRDGSVTVMKEVTA